MLCVLLDLAPVAERPPAEQLAVLLDELGATSPTCSSAQRWWWAAGPTWRTADRRTGGVDAGAGSKGRGGLDLRISA